MNDDIQTPELMPEQLLGKIYTQRGASDPTVVEEITPAQEKEIRQLFGLIKNNETLIELGRLLQELEIEALPPIPSEGLNPKEYLHLLQFLAQSFENGFEGFGLGKLILNFVDAEYKFYLRTKERPIESLGKFQISITFKPRIGKDGVKTYKVSANLSAKQRIDEDFRNIVGVNVYTGKQGSLVLGGFNRKFIFKNLFELKQEDSKKVRALGQNIERKVRGFFR